MKFPPEYGPLAAVTPGTPGGLMTMLAEYGTMSLTQVLAPAIEMADGYPMEAELVDTIEHNEDRIKQWPDSRRVMLIAPRTRHTRRRYPGRDVPPARTRGHAAQARGGREARRSRPARTAKRRSTPPTTASTRATSPRNSHARCVREAGGLITLEDLANWKVKIEEPVHISYKGIEVYKLNTWVQGPVMLQTLNILEGTST